MKSRMWKQHESNWAELLGGKRVPVSGRGRGDQPDVAHERFSVEVKAGAVLSSRALDGMAQAVASIKGGQVPIVCISNRKPGAKIVNGYYVLMRAEDFVTLISRLPS